MIDILEFRAELKTDAVAEKPPRLQPIVCRSSTRQSTALIHLPSAIAPNRIAWTRIISSHESFAMEDLSLQDTPPGGSTGALGPNHAPAPALPAGGPPQLPPQMFTTAAQLLDLTDSEILPSGD